MLLLLVLTDWLWAHRCDQKAAQGENSLLWTSTILAMLQPWRG